MVMNNRNMESDYHPLRYKSDKIESYEDIVKRLLTVNDFNNKQLGWNYSVILDFTYSTKKLNKVKEQFKKELDKLTEKYRKITNQNGEGLSYSKVEHPLTEFNHSYSTHQHINRLEVLKRIEEVTDKHKIQPKGNLHDSLS